MRTVRRLASSTLSHGAFALLLGLGAVACSGSSSSGQEPGGSVAQSGLARNTAPNVAPADAATLVAGNTHFAADLYREAGKDHAHDNFFFSPYSVSAALSMTYAGAANDTAKQMASAAHFDLAQDKLFPAFDKLDLDLNSRAVKTADGRQGLELHVVNSVWGEESFHFAQPYLDTLAVNYGAGVRLTDFAHAPEDARSRINGWVSDETSQKIVDLLPGGSITTDTRFVLVNAVYFKASWSSPFDATFTKPQAFKKLDGSSAQVPTMSQVSYYSYGASEDFETLELPYAGEQTAMDIILPSEGAFDKVSGALSADMLSTALDNLKPTEAHVALPKFSIAGGTISLKDSMKSLGMTDAFDGSKADFSGVSQEHVWIGDVLHQAFVTVDEVGTEAAAATAVEMVGGAAPQTPKEFVVNRPFLVVIRDVTTKSVLFAGRVTDPK